MDGTTSPHMRLRAKAEFDRILKQHQPEPLSDQKQLELKAIIEAAHNDIGM